VRIRLGLSGKIGERLGYRVGRPDSGRLIRDKIVL
jgi:hypothetical protein